MNKILRPVPFFFKNVAENHHPSFYKEDKWKKILKEWMNRSYKERKEKDAFEEFMRKKSENINISGYIFKYPDLYSIDNVDKCIPWNEEYLDLMEKKYKSSHKIRSFVAQPLIYQNVKVGVIILTDTIKSAFYHSDKLFFHSISYIIAKHMYYIKKSKILFPTKKKK